MNGCMRVCVGGGFVIDKKKGREREKRKGDDT